jgi:hypothetical protein
MLQFSDPVMNAAMFRCAERAARHGRSRPALLIAESAAASRPGLEESIRLSSIQAACGRSADARRTLEAALETWPTSMWVPVHLALLDATCGHLVESSRILESLVVEHPFERILRYHLGSVLAQIGRFDDANAQFGHGTLVSCGDGKSTSACIVRFPTQPGDGSIPLPVQREVDLDCGAQSGSPAEAIYFVACDSRYFRLFAVAMLRSIATFSGLRCVVHFHLINPDHAAMADVARLQHASPLPVVWSKETAALEDLGADQRRAYYASARFLVLPELRRRYSVPIIAADIDQLVIRNLTSILADSAAADIGLIKFSTQAANILALVSATSLIVNPTQGAACFLNTVHDVLAERMSDPTAFGWHLDQAALAVAHLFHRELNYSLLAPAILDSSTDLQGVTAKPAEGAALWSITASHPHNMAKLANSRASCKNPEAPAFLPPRRGFRLAGGKIAR